MRLEGLVWHDNMQFSQNCARMSCMAARCQQQLMYSMVGI